MVRDGFWIVQCRFGCSSGFWIYDVDCWGWYDTLCERPLNLSSSSVLGCMGGSCGHAVLTARSWTTPKPKTRRLFARSYKGKYHTTLSRNKRHLQNNHFAITSTHQKAKPTVFFTWSVKSRPSWGAFGLDRRPSAPNKSAGRREERAEKIHRVERCIIQIKTVVYMDFYKKKHTWLSELYTTHTRRKPIVLHPCRTTLPAKKSNNIKRVLHLFIATTTVQ